MYKDVKKRADWVQFMQLPGVESYTLWGWGVESSGLSYEMEEEEKQFVTQRAPFTIQSGYSLAQDVEEIVYADSPLFKAIDKIRRTHGMNNEATGKMLNCNLYEEKELKPASCSAEEYDIIITITEFAPGESGEPLSISYSVKYQSEPRPGTATFEWEEHTVTFAEGPATRSLPKK